MYWNGNVWLRLKKEKLLQDHQINISAFMSWYLDQDVLNNLAPGKQNMAPLLAEHPIFRWATFSSGNSLIVKHTIFGCIFLAHMKHATFCLNPSIFQAIKNTGTCFLLLRCTQVDWSFKQVTAWNVYLIWDLGFACEDYLLV